MCNPLLLSTFILLCHSFLATNPISNNTLSRGNCVKAYDVCVDRKSWEVVENLSNLEPIQIDNLALNECVLTLKSVDKFNEFYTDNRCENRN